MELSPLPVMLFLILLLPLPHAKESEGRVYTDRTIQEISIRPVTDSDSGNYTYRGQTNHSESSEISDAVTLNVSERPHAVLSVSPQSWMTEGDSVTLSCEVTEPYTNWTFSWHRDFLSRDNEGHIRYRVELLSDSSRGSGGNYTLSSTALNHTGVYICSAETEDSSFYSHYSFPEPLWITGESPPVSLIINPSRTQHFTDDSLALICKEQSNSTVWTVRRYIHNKRALDCEMWGLVNGSTCNVSSLSVSYTGVYWCECESGENSNPVNITVHDGDVILESPVHPVTEGHPLTLRCLNRKTNSSNLRADFYKNGSVLQTRTTGEMIIHKVSKSDEGFYHCNHPDSGMSPKSWVSVRSSGSGYRKETVEVAVGLCVAFLFVILIFLMIPLWCCKIKKEKQQKTNQTFKQNQSWPESEDSPSGYTPLQAVMVNVHDTADWADISGTDEAAAESSEVIYTQVIIKTKETKNDVDAETSGGDVTYAEIKRKTNIYDEIQEAPH